MGRDGTKQDRAGPTLRHRHMALRLALSLAVLLTLDACYASREPVILNGERMPIAGSYQCRDMRTGKTYGFTFRERSIGSFLLAYQYEANQKTYKFIKIDSTTYLGQEGDERNKLVNLFLLRPVGKGAALWVPDVTTHGHRLDALLAENRVNINGRTFDNGVILEGEAQNKITVMKVMPQEFLKLVAICEPD